jgi:hypothetical protein
MRRSRALALASATAVAIAVPLTAGNASTPQSESVSVPTSTGVTITRTWTGTIPPGVNPTSQCDGTTPEDTHDINLTVPAGVYSKVTALFTFTIKWTPSSPSASTSDEILTVTGPNPGQEVGSSDGGSPMEQVTASNLQAAKGSTVGKYVVRACGFSNALPQPYTGTLVIKTEGLASESSLPSAPANGLAFSPSVAADPQRDEAEPLIETAPDGRTYTCGPTGFGSASDYAQVSTDGGDQFHLLGTPPRGQQSVGGGGDCAMNLAPDKNSLGNYQYAYAGLGPLTGFATSTSPDNGHSLQSAGPQGNGLQNTGALADRQWNVFLDKDTVLLSYNQQAPRNIVVQRSDDGGLTYGPITAVAGANPDFPGPMRTLPAKFNTKNPGIRPVYFGWNKGTNVNLSVSYDGGRTFVDCVAATDPGVPRAGFVTVDNDSAGNIYIAYAEKARFHTYMVVLPAGNLGKCNQAIGTATNAKQPKNDPAAIGFTKPVQVDRDKVRTTVFPWVAAGGAAGRVAVTFYGTESEGDPNVGSFKASWNVYVNQSVNALSSSRTFSQVKATTRPFHYDSICLNGLGCSLSNPPGDRSLADFFAIKTNPASGRLQVVYDNDAKKPGEQEGHVASPMVFTQIGGPSIKGGTISGGNRPVLRQASTDPTGDALAHYSSLGTSPPPTNEPATDLTSVSIAPPATGDGFDVVMKVASLSKVNLDKALADTNSKSLLYVLRFGDGFRVSAVDARYSASGWQFRYNDYDALRTECFAPPATGSDKCLAFGANDTTTTGTVSVSAGTIRIHAPIRFPAGKIFLYGLQGGQGDQQRPQQVLATSGTRFYEASAFTFGDVLDRPPGTKEVQTYLYPLDNTPAMDFLLP